MKVSSVPIWKNSLFLFFSQTIRLFTNVFISVGIARFYGPEAFGQFSIAYTIATICIVVADFGFDVLLTTEIANNRDQAENIAKKYFSMKILFALLSSVIMIAISSSNLFSIQSLSLIYSLTLFVILTTFINFFNAIYRGFEKFDYETQISFITNLFFLIVFCIFCLLRLPLFFVIILFIVSRFIGVLLSARKAILLVGANFIGIDFKEWRKIINQILIYGIHFLFGSLFFQLDTILLGMWRGDNDVGIYKSAFNIMLLILVITDIAFTAILPLLTRLYNENYEKWQSMCRLYFKVFFLSVLPISLVVFIYSDQIISIIYGNKLFKEAIPVLKIFSIVILFRFIGEPFALMLTTSGRQHIRMIIVIFATFTSLVWNYFFIPKYGFYGAAFVSLGINFIVGMAYIFANGFSYFKWITELRNFIVFASIILISLFLNYYSSDLVFLFILLGVYVVIAYFLVLSDKERMIIYLDVFPNKKG